MMQALRKRFWLWAYAHVERRSRPYRPVAFTERVSSPYAQQGVAQTPSVSKARIRQRLR